MIFWTVTMCRYVLWIRLMRTVVCVYMHHERKQKTNGFKLIQSQTSMWLRNNSNQISFWINSNCVPNKMRSKFCFLKKIKQNSFALWCHSKSYLALSDCIMIFVVEVRLFLQVIYNQRILQSQCDRFWMDKRVTSV